MAKKSNNDIQYATLSDDLKSKVNIIKIKVTHVT